MTAFRAYVVGKHEIEQAMVLLAIKLSNPHVGIGECANVADDIGVISVLGSGVAMAAYNAHAYDAAVAIDALDAGWWKRRRRSSP